MPLKPCETLSGSPIVPPSEPPLQFALPHVLFTLSYKSSRTRASCSEKGPFCKLQKSIGVSKWITTAFKFLCGATTPRLSSPPSSHVHCFRWVPRRCSPLQAVPFLFPPEHPFSNSKAAMGSTIPRAIFSMFPCACFIRCAPMAPSFRSASCMCPPVRSKIIRSSACL